MAKDLTSTYPALHASCFQKMNLPEAFEPGTLTRGGRVLASLKMARQAIVIEYTITSRGVSVNVSDRVAFDWTFPAYGGRRVWFLCPRCGRRRGVLYLGQRVVCRECLDLAYPCEMQSRMDRGWTLHQRWLSRIADGKPKRMRWKTYGKLREKAAIRANARLQAFLATWKLKGLPV